MIQVVWFKRDLRTVDHAPLAVAAASGPVLPLYVFEPEYWHLPDVSCRQWLVTAAALAELDARLEKLGAPLIVRRGRVVDVLARIHAAVGIAQLLAHEETGNLWTFHRDIAVRSFCRRERIAFREFSQTGVIRGSWARERWAEHFARFIEAPGHPEPARLLEVAGARTQPIPTASELGLADDGCATPQPGTRAVAMERLDSFLAGRGHDYRRAMSSPLRAEQGCSRLSVALATGSVSVREVLKRLRLARQELADRPATERAIPITAIDSLTARLHWRSHFMQKLESEPAVEIRSFHALHEAGRFSTADDDPLLAAWASGRTGLPFVDACMRSLIATGWLNFRMRAMLQCVASQHLALDWRASGVRLARLFCDYEPGIHWPQVQMQSGQTGINVPRLYNPVKQGREQDPDGVFTRRWVPELADLPLALLQTPWRAATPSLHDYPAPVVEPVAAARAARVRLTALRDVEGYALEALKVFRRHGSRKRRFHNRYAHRLPGKGRPTVVPPAQLDLTLDSRDGATPASPQVEPDG